MNRRPQNFVTCLAENGAGSAPKRVAVIGSGPAGLSSAIALRHLNTGVEHVTVFERRSELRPELGAGLNINGGAAVLARMGLGDKLMEIGNPIRSIRSRSTDGTELLRFDLEDAFETFAGGDALRHNGELTALTVMRSDLQRLLASELPEGTLQLGKRLVGLEELGRGARVRFDDGTSADFDLVVGADGINSRVRELVFGPQEPRRSNIRIQFGVCPPGAGPRAPQEQLELHQWFGDGAYCLVYTGGSRAARQDMVALVRGGTADVPENAGWDASAVRGDCLERLRRGGFPPEVLVVAESCDRFFDIGVRYHETLPTWSRRGSVVLLGDAAHAMPPFLGQGANQAIQDAYSLAANLAGVGSRHRSTEDAVRAFERARIPPTAAIMQSSRFLGALETQSGLGGLVRNAIFYSMGKLRVAEKVYVDGAGVRV